MANDKLYITISDNRIGQSGTPTSQTANQNKDKEDSSLQRYAEHQLFHTIKSTVTQTVNYQIANIGNMTGDYITQRKINVAKETVSKLSTIAMSTIAGAKYGGYGAIVGFAVGTLSVMLGSFFEINSNLLENQKTNYSISQLRERAGLNTIYDGSRGTEN